jgi:hypothetical protein
MSLAVDGFWKAGFWDTTFWADGFWSEGVVASDDPVSSPGGRKKRKHDDDLVRQVIEKWDDIEARRAPVIAPPAHVVIPERIEPAPRTSSRELLTFLMLAEIDD